MHTYEMQKNRLSLYEGALNSINAGTASKCQFYPLLAMQLSAGGNAVGIFAVRWAAGMCRNIYIYTL